MPEIAFARRSLGTCSWWRQIREPCYQRSPPTIEWSRPAALTTRTSSNSICSPGNRTLKRFPSDKLLQLHFLILGFPNYGSTSIMTLIFNSSSRFNVLNSSYGFIHRFQSDLFYFIKIIHNISYFNLGHRITKFGNTCTKPH